MLWDWTMVVTLHREFTLWVSTLISNKKYRAMFKLKNILQLSALMFFVMSCDDYLETPPADLMTSDGFYQTPSQSEQGVVGIYSDLRELAIQSIY